MLRALLWVVVIAGAAWGLSTAVERYSLLQTAQPERMARAEAASQELVDRHYPQLSSAERFVGIGTIYERVSYIVDFYEGQGEVRTALRVIVDRSTFQAEALEYVELAGGG